MPKAICLVLRQVLVVGASYAVDDPGRSVDDPGGGNTNDLGSYSVISPLPLRLLQRSLPLCRLSPLL